MTPTRAATVSVQGSNPSIDLHSLISCLNQAIPSHSGKLFIYDVEKKALAINLNHALSRLTKLLEEKKCVNLLPAKGQTQGFVRDLQLPKLGQRAWYGGRIVAGTEEELTAAINQLVETIDTELSQALSGFNPIDLLIDDPKQHIATLVERIKIKEWQGLTGKVKLNVIKLTYEHNANKRFGRVFTSIETIEGERSSRSENLLTALRREFEREEIPNVDTRCEELKELVEQDLNSEKSHSENQINRFLNFLEDDALARVRLEICFELLRNLSSYLANRSRENDWPLIDYVRRCTMFYHILTNPETELLTIEASAHYYNADFVLNNEAMNASFYNALPIFPQPDTQIFEQANINSIAREISYRFRINGNNPEAEKSAFTARLERIRETLVNSEQIGNVKRHLQELVLLFAVTPKDDKVLNDAELQAELMQRIAIVQARVQKEGMQGINKLLDELFSRQDLMEKAAKQLVYAMRQPGSAIGQKNYIFYLNVLNGLINIDDLLGSMQNPLSPSAQPNTAKDGEKIHFIKHVRISRDRPRMKSDTMLSIKIEVSVGESYLVAEGEPSEFDIERQLPDCLVQMLWQPLVSKTDVPLYEEFLLPKRIVVRYKNDFLIEDKNNEESIQMLAVKRTAFTILSYIASMRVLKQIANKQTKPHVLVLRLQTDNKTSLQNTSAVNIVYAASQAFEHILNRDYSCRLQGLVVSQADLQKQDQFFYRKRSTLYALCAGFPLQINKPPNTSYPSERHKTTPIGIMTFATRPCDDHPDIDYPARKGFIVIMKTYVLKPNEQNYLISPDLVRISIMESEDRARQPDLIKEQIRRFQEDKIQHVIYLVHRFGERRRGRSHHRQRVHDDPNFLNSLYENFDDLFLYPLVRDVFPAVRLSGGDQQGKDGAYEITSVGLQGYRLPESFEYVRTNYTPVYSIGTLRIVGKESDNKPQSGICTYFLLNDVRPKDEQRMQRVRSYLLLPESGMREDLLMALRSVHLLESEEVPLKNSSLVRPVLDPYRWISPDTLENAGDIPIYEKNNNKSVVLSLQAVLARISDILHQE
jgi:hypothetical protein